MLICACAKSKIQFLKEVIDMNGMNNVIKFHMAKLPREMSLS